MAVCCCPVGWPGEWRAARGERRERPNGHMAERPKGQMAKWLFIIVITNAAVIIICLLAALARHAFVI